MNIKNLFVVFCVAFSFAITSCKGQQDDGRLKIVSPEEMQTLLQSDNMQLIDVRTPKEYDSGFIANAQNIDYFSPTFDEDIKKLDKEKPIILYCKSGRRSSKCSDKLLQAGFEKIYELDGGIIQWKKRGLEITTK